MTVVETLTGAPPAQISDWESIPWTKVKYQVKRLQMRIAKAARNKQFSKVKALQRLLTSSYYAKCLAVKRVKQNKGSKCPGVDGIVWRTNRQAMSAALSLKRRGYKTKPLRRIYIPKSSNPKALRPLSIPTMKDRAMQALYLLSLEPLAEIMADKNSYGFRPKRSAADAIEQCFNCLSRRNSAKWVLEGDILSFFDTVNFQWLQKNIPMDKTILQKFLTAAYFENGLLEANQAGIPQGGIISPCISLIALSGIEKRLTQKYKKHRGKINLIFYADDFIVTGESKEILENEVIPLISEFLAERGLVLSRNKTRITHINEGFDFLGFNIRKYKEKCITKPSKVAIKSFLRTIKATIKANAGAKTENLIRQLNPKIKGWSNYYQHSASSRTFSYIDHRIFKLLYKWALKRHPNKGARWINAKYFQRSKLNRWHFHTIVRKNEQKCYLDLTLAGHTKIRRHSKIIAEATPYDPQFVEYFRERGIKAKKTSTFGSFVAGSVISGLINA